MERHDPRRSPAGPGERDGSTPTAVDPSRLALPFPWLLCALLFVTSCAGSGARSIEVDPAPDCCSTCPRARLVNGWCGDCDHGHVAGVVVESRRFHADLDAHGHGIDPERIACAECVAAIEVDGFCSRCGFGYVDGDLYYTELTWSLHRGEPRLFDTLRCDGCRDAHGTTGVCRDCGTLWVGNVAFDDPEIHARAARQFERLRLALDRIGPCAMCPSAGFFGRPCPLCGRAPIPDGPEDDPPVGGGDDPPGSND